MSSNSRRFFRFATASIVVFAIMLSAGTAFAEKDESPVRISFDDKLVYCSVQQINISDQAILALNQGTPVSFVWQISIHSTVDYWLDNEVANVIIARQAIPDLISKSLIVTDAQNGISRRVHTIDEAIEFLSELKHFAIIDRSLLEAGKNYTVSVEFHIQEGQYDPSWWSDLISFTDSVAETGFVLP